LPRFEAAFAPGIAITSRLRKRRDLLLNPGMGNVGTLCREPAVAARVIETMLAPAVASGLLTLLRRCRITSCAVQGDRIAGVEAVDLETGASLSISASSGALIPRADRR